MTWDKITLGQFQDIYKLSKDKALDEFDKVSRIISIVYNFTEAQVDELPLTKFNELSRNCAFILKDEIPGKAVRSFSVSGRKYAINYKPSTLKHRQYVEILHFANNSMDNMHNIMASLVQPVKWGMRKPNKVGYRIQPNSADDHAKVADDMLNAPFTVVYHSCIFFCKLYKASIEHIQDYLIAEMMTKGMTEQKATRMLNYSISAMDGFITQKRWPDLKA